MNRITDNGIMTIHAGDTIIAPLFLNIGDIITPIRYVLKEDDRLYVGIMEPGQPFTHALIRKMLTKDDLNELGDPELKLTPEDTERVMPGLYYYEVKLLTHDEETGEEVVETIISKKKIYVLE